MANIGVLGGSFDPVHCAHLEIAGQALAEFNLDFIIFVPAYVPPHKNKLEVSDQHRYDMLRLAVSNSKKFIVETFEIDCKRVVYSYETLDFLSKKYVGDRIKMIIGSDSFNQLNTWKRAEYIACTYGFIVIKRPGNDPEKKSFFYKYADISKFTAHNISSTSIRNMLMKNLDVKEKLPENVLDYIRKNELYKK